MPLIVSRLCRLVAAMLAVGLIGGTLAPPALATGVRVSDGPHDAYRVPGTTGGPDADQPPNPSLSDSAADIRQAGFDNHSSGLLYSATVTVEGAPDPGHNYIVGGDYGADCRIFHLLTPNTVSRANIFCGKSDAEFVDSFQGSVVTMRGNSVSATFAYRSARVPPASRLHPEITGVFALTCWTIDGSRGCTPAVTLDWAVDPSVRFRF